MPGLLLIYAHPDDETFFAAGVIAKYSAAGVPVTLICATRGERGNTSNLCSMEALPRVREGELRQAGRILGIGEIEMLSYEDQKLSAAPVDEIRRSITAAVRRHRPEIVITFDPEGANRHGDHIAISRFAADAVSAAADARWYPETGGAHSVKRVLWQAPIPPFELGRTKDLALRPGIDILVDISEFREKKQAALRAHRTQFAGLNRLFSTEGALSFEAFRIGEGARPQRAPAGDLFDGSSGGGR